MIAAANSSSARHAHRPRRRLLALAAAAALIPVLAGCAGTASEASTPLPPNGTTEYVRVGNAITTPVSDSKILLEVPPTEGFDGGTTVISIEPTSSWTWDAMPSIDNDSLYGGTMRTQVRGGWGVCEGWVGFIRDTTSRQETRWTVSEENYGKALGLFMLGQYNIDHSERFIDGGGDIVMPFHEEGLGQFRFSAWDIPASASNVPFDVKTWIGPDYNTGYMTTVSVSCVDPKDVAAMFEQMATPGNEYSIYVDVLPSTAQK